LALNANVDRLVRTPAPISTPELVEIPLLCRFSRRKAAADQRCLDVEMTKVCHCGVQVTAFPTFPD
jgi:hypothetical protein